MKIINFISGKDLGGPKQSFVLYSEALTQLDNQVVSVIRKGAQIKNLLADRNLQVVEVDYFRAIGSFFRNRATKKIKNAFDPVNADLVFVHKPMDISLVRDIVGSNVTIVGIIHGFDAKYTEDADALIAVSKKVKDFLHDAGIQVPIYIIPNMIKINKKPQYRDLPPIPLIGAMGVYRRKKGFHIMIRALSILKARKVPFRAVIAGKGQLKPYLLYLRWKLQLTDELKIRSWVPNSEREQFVDNIDLYVLPSRTETFGMVIVEAMARIKRVIATKCGGPEEIINDGINGYLVTKQSPEALADKLEELIINPNISSSVAIEASRDAVGKYTLTPIKILLNNMMKEFKNHE